MTVADELQALLTATIAEALLIEVDLAAVTFIDSTVIITHRNATAAGAHLSVSNSTRHAHRVLDMTGVLPTISTDPNPAV